MKEVKKLKEAGTFIVEEWTDLMRANGIASIGVSSVKTHEYVFKHEGGKLYIADNTDVKRDKFSEVIDAEKTLADLAKEECVMWANIIPAEGVSFHLYNPRIRFLDKQ